MNNWLLPHYQQLTQQLHENTLPHAMLISGMQGAGKSKLASWLLKVLMCQTPIKTEYSYVQACGQCKTCKLLLANNHPDFLNIAPEGRHVSIDQVRLLSRFFEKTPHLGDRQVSIVSHADTMTVAASNALLKTLEEPNTGRFIILTVNDAQSMLPTIISRCRLIDIRPSAGESLSTLYSNQETNSQFANISHLPELSDDKIKLEYLNVVQGFNNLLISPSNAIGFITLLSSSQYAWRWLEKLISNLAREKSQWLVQSNQDAVNLTSETCWQIYSTFVIAQKKRSSLMQVNEQYLLEKLITDIAFVILNSRK